jgi:hypothetical protein
MMEMEIVSQLQMSRCPGHTIAKTCNLNRVALRRVLSKLSRALSWSCPLCTRTLPQMVLGSFNAHILEAEALEASKRPRERRRVMVSEIV